MKSTKENSSSLLLRGELWPMLLDKAVTNMEGNIMNIRKEIKSVY